jgi:glucose/arabinose dehydrogenase
LPTIKAPGPALEKIKLPPGFRIDLYATGIEGARSMALGPQGVLFVGTRNEGKVYAVLDRDEDQKADEVLTIARGLNMPNGVAYRNGALYVAEVSRILRFDGIADRLYNPPKPVIVSKAFPRTGTTAGNISPSGPTGCSTSPWVPRATSARRRTGATPRSCG